MKSDQDYLKMAISLAEKNLRDNKGGPIGALIVKEGKIISKSYNESFLHCDPTSHAEIQAIRKACKKLKTLYLEDCVIYTSCEPCPMCLGAIYWVKIKKIFFAASIEDTQKVGFDDKHLFREFSRPDQSKEIPRQQLCRNEALVALAVWKHIGDKRVKEFEKNSEK